MSKSRELAILMMIFTAVVFSSCGGGSSSSDTAPTVSSIKDGNDVDVVNDATGIYPDTFTITFSEAMDPTTVTTAGNVTMTCDGPDVLANPTLTVAAADSENTIFTVTLTDAYKYQLLSCTLTISTNVTSASVSASSVGRAVTAKSAVAENITYTFTNACAVGDDFNINSQSCWTVWDYDGSQTWPTWEALLNTTTGLLTFETDDSTLLYSSIGKTADSEANIYKAAAPGSEAFSITAKFDNISEFGSAYDGLTHAVELLTNDPATLEDPGKDADATLVLYIASDSEAILCAVGFSGDTELIYYVDCSSQETVYVRARFDGAEMHPEWSTDGLTFDDMTDSIGSGTFPTDYSAYGYLMIYMGTEETSPDRTVYLDTIDTTGLTSADQY